MHCIFWFISPKYTGKTGEFCKNGWYTTVIFARTGWKFGGNSQGSEQRRCIFLCFPHMDNRPPTVDGFKNGAIKQREIRPEWISENHTSGRRTAPPLRKRPKFSAPVVGATIGRPFFHLSPNVGGRPMAAPTGITITSPNNAKDRRDAFSRPGGGCYFAFFLKIKLRKRMMFITTKKAARRISVR